MYRLALKYSMRTPSKAPHLPRPGTPDAEVEILLLQLRQAHALLDRAAATSDRAASIRGVEQATETLSSVKNIMPKLGLTPTQIDSVQQQLALVEARLASR